MFGCTNFGLLNVLNAQLKFQLTILLDLTSFFFFVFFCDMMYSKHKHITATNENANSFPLDQKKGL